MIKIAYVTESKYQYLSVFLYTTLYVIGLYYITVTILFTSGFGAKKNYFLGFPSLRK